MYTVTSPHRISSDAAAHGALPALSVSQQHAPKLVAVQHTPKPHHHAAEI